MEVALRRRLEGVADISISESRQTTVVSFEGGPQAFSPQVFRDALDEAGVEVLRFQLEACGRIEQSGDQRWLTAGRNRFLLDDASPTPAAGLTCVSGRLDDRSTPPKLEVTSTNDPRAGDAS